MRLPSKRLIAGFGSLLIIAVLCMGVWNALRPLPAIAASIQSLSSPNEELTLTWPSKGVAAVGAVGYGTLATSGDETPRPIASIAKVITALTVLGHAPLKLNESGPTYTIGANEVATYNDYVARGGSVVNVSQGEVITEYQALQALMLPSANNMADSLAGWTFGSLNDYFVAANKMVKELGMVHTTVAGDASGLMPTTTSTATDLILLGQAALRNPVLAQIVSQKTADLPVAGTVYNVNTLLGTDGIIGIKTGDTDEAGGCLLSAANTVVGGKTITVIGAVMGAVNRPAALAATLPLLDSAKAGFSVSTPVRAGQTIASYKLPWGKTATAVAKHTISFVSWNGSAITASAEMNKLDGMVKQNTKLGVLTIVSGDQQFTTDVIAQPTTPAPSLWWRLTRH